jgi:hypothetical protein
VASGRARAGRSKQAQAARQQREEAEREQAAEREAREARGYRATVSGCRIDPVTGGEFTVTAPEHLDMHFAVAPDMALQFRSLRNRDAVEITLAPDGHGGGAVLAPGPCQRREAA